MLRFFGALIAIILVACTLSLPAAATRRWFDYPNSGYCPAGTCSGNGGFRAINVKNCRPSNCRRPLN
jgi:hypothetical protein